MVPDSVEGSSPRSVVPAFMIVPSEKMASPTVATQPEIRRVNSRRRPRAKTATRTPVTTKLALCTSPKSPRRRTLGYGTSFSVVGPQPTERM